MAGRPSKKGIDYAGWDVDIFDGDHKIDKLMDYQGCKGFVIYFYLCQKAYGSNGYFYEWSYDDTSTTARRIGGVGSQTVEDTVRLCLQISLFEQGLFDRYKILTSRGIQKRYLQVVQSRTGNIEIIGDYWLLERIEKTHKGGRFIYDTQKTNFDTPKCEFHTSEIELCPPKVKERKDIYINNDDDANIELQKTNFDTPKCEFHTSEMPASESSELRIRLNRNSKGLKIVQAHYEKYIGGMMSSTAVTETLDFLDEGVESSLICQAINVSVDNKKSNWRYARKVVLNWVNDKILTLDQYKVHESNRDAEKARADKAVTAPKTEKPKQNRFVNFKQRDTDYSQYEKLERAYIEQKLREPEEEAVT